jgi:DNA-binding Xre family transcriptional regulator
VKEMSVKDVVVHRFRKLCEQRKIKINELANISGVTPSTAYSMMDESRRDISIVTIKKFCDGLEITLGEFFSDPEFDNLEQEIK